MAIKVKLFLKKPMSSLLVSERAHGQKIAEIFHSRFCLMYQIIEDKLKDWTMGNNGGCYSYDIYVYTRGAVSDYFTHYS